MSLEDTLRKQALIIDWVDGFVGPLSTMMYMTGSENLHTVANVLSLSELFLMKVPFTLNYIAKTGDAKSLLYFAPKELFANLTHYGGFLDIIPTYVLRINSYLSSSNA